VPAAPSSDVTVRPARGADAQRVLDLLEAFATSYRPDPAAFTSHFPALLRSDNVAFLVAERAGRVIGYVLAFDLLTLWANGVVVELQELCVDPAERGRGAGRALVEAVLARARHVRAREVTVPTRRAADFYTKLGFEETAAYLKRRL
jgi:N-acetylglutamate synthase-like GNAT family acetyltransferase